MAKSQLRLLPHLAQQELEVQTPFREVSRIRLQRDTTELLATFKIQERGCHRLASSSFLNSSHHSACSHDIESKQEEMCKDRLFPGAADAFYPPLASQAASALQR